MAEVSGSIPLTQRLVEAAGEAVFDEARKWPTPPPFSGAIPGFTGATKQDVGRRAVVAMLLDLAEGLTNEGRPSVTVTGLLELAESVERGE